MGVFISTTQGFHQKLQTVSIKTSYFSPVVFQIVSVNVNSLHIYKKVHISMQFLAIVHRDNHYMQHICVNHLEFPKMSEIGTFQEEMPLMTLNETSDCNHSNENGDVQCYNISMTSIDLFVQVLTGIEQLTQLPPPHTTLVNCEYYKAVILD